MGSKYWLQIKDVDQIKDMDQYNEFEIHSSIASYTCAHRWLNPEPTCALRNQTQ